MKKKTLRKLAVALPLSVAAVIGVACAVQDYQGGAVFQPFASDRALQSNQVLFPDDGERTEQGMGDETDDSALWEKDREAEEASRPQQQDRADYLFQDNTPDTPSGTLAGTTTPQGTTRPGKAPGSILDIVGGSGSNADLIIGGGSQPGVTVVSLFRKSSMSPRAARAPALHPAANPRFRSRRTRVKRVPNRAAPAAASSVAVASSEPLSTTSTSVSVSSPSSCAASERRQASVVSQRFHAGMMIEKPMGGAPCHRAISV